MRNLIGIGADSFSKTSASPPSNFIEIESLLRAHLDKLRVVVLVCRPDELGRAV
jgi:hypothetical protein